MSTNRRIEPSELEVRADLSIREALERLDRTAKGLLLLVDEDRKLRRTVSDGDLRRLLLAGHPLTSDLSALPPRQPRLLVQGYSASEALRLMDDNGISHVAVVDDEHRVLTVLTRKDVTPILLSTPHLGEHEQEYVAEAFRTNWIAPLGPNVDAFESELAEYVGVEHAAALSSGTAAIHLALRLLEVSPGDVVFCSSFTFIASASPIVYQGATPVFIDSEPDSWNMSPAALRRALKEHADRGKLPKAVILVNLYGQSADMDSISAICDEYGVPIVEDAAESLGGEYKGRMSGSFGKLSIFSFNGNKIITTSGGGMLMSNDGDLIRRARFLSTQARDVAPHYEHTTIGYNYRMSNVLAGIGRGQLRVLNDRIATRRGLFERYREAFASVEGVEWMPEPAETRSNRWLSTLTLAPEAGVSAAEVTKLLSQANIETRPLWKPMHLQPVFKDCAYYPHGEAESVCDDLFERGLCLPSSSNMKASDQDRVIAAFLDAMKVPAHA